MKKQAAGPQQPRHLGDPGVLQVFGQVGENREGVDQVEAAVRIGERRRQRADLGFGETQVLLRPGDRGRVDVDAADPGLAGERLEVAQHPAAARAEIENGAAIFELAAVPAEGQPQAVDGRGAAFEEPADARRSGHRDHPQHARGLRALVLAEPPQALRQIRHFHDLEGGVKVERPAAAGRPQDDPVDPVAEHRPLLRSG